MIYHLSFSKKLLFPFGRRELDVRWRLNTMWIQSYYQPIPVFLFLILLLLQFNVVKGAINDKSSPSPTAQTRHGTYQGRYLSEFNQDLFLGIPFADAPRLDNPLPLNTTWLGNHEALEYGPTCCGFGSNTLLNLTLSEDCLNLNIIRPGGTKANEKLPVLLWMYGGGFRQGASADPMWNMSYVVQTSVQNKQAVIGVSINYRLSFLGFPGGRQSLDAGITNLGLKDQRIALEWIQENIAAFGGDRRKVTIWGESAGGQSVANQILAYGGRGGADLFRSGIMASGFMTGVHPGFATDKQAGYDLIVQNANCSGAVDTLACLRAAPLSAIWPFEDTTGTTWSPVIDGTFLRRAPVSEVENGNVARVPILLGSNSDEGLFVASLVNTTVSTPAALTALLQSVFSGTYNSTINSLLTLYPDVGPEPPYVLSSDYPWCDAMAMIHLNCGAEWRRFAAIIGDWFAHASRRYLSTQWARLGLPTYSYRFDTDPTAIPLVYWVGLGPGFALHGAELAYEFGLPAGFTTPIDFYPPVLNVSSHIAVSHAMVSKWVSFAHSGDPNAVVLDSVPEWPSYDLSASNMVFNATADGGLYIHVEDDTYRAEGINFINSHLGELEYGSP